MEYVQSIMSYSMQGTPYFSQKVSLSKISQNRPVGNFAERLDSGLDYRNHISWEDEMVQSKGHNSSQLNSAKLPRRRIFDKFQSKQDQKQQNRQKSASQSKQKSKLNKVKSNPTVTFQPFSQIQEPDARIQEINRQLKVHRENMRSSRVNRLQQSSKKSKVDSMNWAKIQEKLSQSKQILKRQQQILSTKIPTFQKKIQDNNAAITQVTKLIKMKLDNQSKKMQDIYSMIEKNGERIKNRQEELSRINSELVLKESQIMRNKEINKRRELELQRIKRIQDLQNKNLEIYHKIEKKDQFSQLQDIHIQDEEQPCQVQYWSDSDQEQKMSKLSVNKISTIQYSDHLSGNETIGELLSPLTLIQNQYLI